MGEVADLSPNQQDFLPASPKHLRTIETILGGSFFAEDSQMAHGSIIQLAPQKLEFRAVAYNATLRKMAEQRAAERKQHCAAPTYNARDFNQAYTFTEQTGDLRSDSSIRFLGRQLTILNNFERSIQKQQVGEDGTVLRDDQHAIFVKIEEFLQAKPNMGEVTNQRAPLARGVTITAPTGSGKSAIMGAVAREIGIGKPASPDDPRPLRALLIVPSLQLVHQFTGTTGDSTFLRFGPPDIKVTPYHAHNKDASGDIVVITKDSLKRPAARKEIDLKDFDVIFSDEVHHLLEPKLNQMLRRGDLGQLIVGFTATPAYNIDRDVRDLLPHVIDGGTVIDYIRSGLLNGAQLFTFRIEMDAKMDTARNESIDRHRNYVLRRSLVKCVADTVVKLTAQGRKVAIYCEKGGASQQARDIADMLQKKGIQAKAVGTFQSADDNMQTLEAFDENNVDVIATTNMLQEGWNAKNVDAVIIAGRIRSPLRRQQIIGRGTRPSPNFPVTVYMEFIPVFPLDDTAPVPSLWEDFGIDRVEQGMIIGGYQAGISDEPPTIQSGRLQANSRRSSPQPPFSINSLPKYLRRIVAHIDGKLVRTLTIATDKEVEPIPSDFVPLVRLQEITGLSLEKIDYRLGKAGIGYRGVWERDPQTATEKLGYYFPPQAVQFLIENPLPPTVRPDRLSIIQICNIFNLPKELVKIFIAEYRTHTPVPEDPDTLHTPELLASILEGAVTTPWAAAHDITPARLATSLGCTERLLQNYIDIKNMTLEFKRIMTREGKLVFRRHLDKTQTAEIVTAFKNAPVATQDQVSLKEFANMLKRLLVPKKFTRLATLFLQAADGSGIQQYLPRELAQSILESERSGPVEPPIYLVPRWVMAQILPLDEEQIKQELAGTEHLVTYFEQANGSCGAYYTWNALRYLIEEQEHGYRARVAPLVYDELPRTDRTARSDSTMYARILQQGHIELLPETTFAPPPSRPQTTISRPDDPFLRPHEWLDAHAISQRIKQPVADVQQAIAALDRGIIQPPQMRRNADQQLTEHFTGRALVMIQQKLQGISPSSAAERVGLPVGVVNAFLEKHYQTNARGAYDQAALLGVIKEFRRPTPGHTPLGTVAQQLECSEDQIKLFLEQNGGKVEYLYDQVGNKQPFLSAFCKKLVTIQSKKERHGHADENWLSREEIAVHTGRPAQDFDKWLWGGRNLESPNQLQWHRTRNDAKVLPHFDPNLVRKYFRTCKS